MKTKIIAALAVLAMVFAATAVIADDSDAADYELTATYDGDGYVLLKIEPLSLDIFTVVVQGVGDPIIVNDFQFDYNPTFVDLGVDLPEGAYTITLVSGDAEIASSEFTVGDVPPTPVDTYTVSFFQNDATEAFYTIEDQQAGETVTFTEAELQEELGVGVEIVKVTYGNEVLIAEDGAYSFVMPAEDAVVDVTTEEVVPAEFTVTYQDGLTVTVAGETLASGDKVVEGATVTVALPELVGATYYLYANNILIEEGDYEVLSDVDFTYTSEPLVPPTETYDVYFYQNDDAASFYAITDVEAGETVTFTEAELQEALGVGVEIVKVTYGNEVLIAEDGVYSFAMPAEDAVVDVTTEEVVPAEFTVTYQDGLTVTVAGETLASGAKVVEGATVTVALPELVGVTYYLYANNILIEEGDYEVLSDVEFTYTDEPLVPPTETYDVYFYVDSEPIDYAITDVEAGAIVEIDPADIIAVIGVGSEIEGMTSDEVEISFVDGFYAFVMPAEDVYVDVALKPLVPPTETYDVYFYQNYAEESFYAIDGVEAGETVTFTEADLQEELGVGVKIIGITSEDVEIAYEDGAYSFAMPADDVYVDVATEEVVLDEYAVTFDAEKIAVTFDGEQVASGDKFAAGTVLNASAVDVPEGQIAVLAGAEFDGNGNFTMPAEDVEITVAYEPIPERSLVSIDVSTKPDKMVYVEDTPFDPTGMEITARYSDDSTAVVEGWTYVPTGNLAMGQDVILISYTEDEGTDDEITAIVSLQIAVVEEEIMSIDIVEPPKTLTYYEGQDFDPAGMVVKAFTNNGKERELAEDEYTITSPVDPLAIGEYTISVYYNENPELTDEDYTVTVWEKYVLWNIYVEPPPFKVIYEEGDCFDTAGMRITATYGNEQGVVMFTSVIWDEEENDYVGPDYGVLRMYNNTQYPDVEGLVPLTMDDIFMFFTYTENEGTDEEITQVVSQYITVTEKPVIEEYTITVEIFGEGTVEVQETAVADEEVSIAFSPAKGYYFKGYESDEVVIYKDEEGNCSFTMPAEDVTIYVSYYPEIGVNSVRYGDMLRVDVYSLVGGEVPDGTVTISYLCKAERNGIIFLDNTVYTAEIDIEGGAQVITDFYFVLDEIPGVMYVKATFEDDEGTTFGENSWIAYERS